jgi:HTH-type transcriptional regulator/antitoxin HigA
MMIRNEREYRITKAAADKFRAAIAAGGKAPPARGVHPKLQQASLEGMRSQLADLDRDLKAYEALKKGTKRLQSKLGELGELLVQARTARGWTQAELAERLDLHMQKIQQYEATNYESASLTRVLDVARTLGLVGDITCKLIDLPALETPAAAKKTTAAR